MHIALDCGDDDLALGPRIAQQLLFRLDEWQQMSHRLLHYASGLHHLGQKHLSRSEQVAYHVHACHERPFDHLDGPSALLGYFNPRRLRIFHDVGGNALDQRMGQPLLYRRIAPGKVFRAFLALSLEAFRKLDQPLGGGGGFAADRAIEQHILDPFQEIRRNIGINPKLPGVHDTHGHARLDRVIKEGRMNRFPHRFVSTERKRYIGYAATHLGIGQRLLDDPGCLDEVHAIAVVFFDTRGDSEYVGIEYDVFGRKTHLIDENPIAAGADFNLALFGVRLARLVERHDDHRRTIAASQLRMFDKLSLAFLEADGVDYGLALHAFEARFDNRPFARIDHHRHTTDIRFGGDKVEEGDHRFLRVEHRLIHVDIDDLRAILHLVAGDAQRLGIIVPQDEAGKRLRAGDVGSLAHIHEQRIIANAERFQSGKPQLLRNIRDAARWNGAHGIGDGLDVCGSRAAAAADDIDKARLRELLDQAGGIFGRLVVAGFRQRVGQAGVGVGAHIYFSRARKLLDVRTHQFRTQGAIQSDR